MVLDGAFDDHGRACVDRDLASPKGDRGKGPTRNVGEERHPLERDDTLDGGQRTTCVDGRRVAFDLVARDQAEEISRGEHGRFVVEVEKLRARVAAKAQKP